MNNVFLYMLNHERLLIAIEEAEKSGKTKDEIASESNVTVQTLYTYIRGKHDPSTKVLGLLAKATGKSAGWLMGEDTNEEPEIKNYRLMHGDAGLADPELMKLMEEELDAIRRLRIEKEKQILANTRSRKERTPGTGEKQ